MPEGCRISVIKAAFWPFFTIINVLAKHQNQRVNRCHPVYGVNFVDMPVLELLARVQ
jgi:hypothetical protein